LYNLGNYQAELLDSTYFVNDLDRTVADITKATYKATVGQAVDGLDTFYKDYANLQVGIVDALSIVDLKISGASQEEIDFQSRILRADPTDRYKMILEKIRNKTTRKKKK